ncbi:hypothetical protein [Photobacterium minamisatsumaniensis]|uniref:hypothetical protein n=1 Tax=Photobacterium minamisatsumaniensis TaxID=2910233 RepID=UPI003D13288B
MQKHIINAIHSFFHSWLKIERCSLCRDYLDNISLALTGFEQYVQERINPYILDGVVSNLVGYNRSKPEWMPDLKSGRSSRFDHQKDRSV